MWRGMRRDQAREETDERDVVVFRLSSSDLLLHSVDEGARASC